MAIKTYNTVRFREKFMQAGQQLESMLQSGFERFFIVRVEDMIRLMKLPVPPNRATSHIIIYLTGGDAVMRIGSQRYQIFKGECLVVPAGQVFSFDNVDLNTGYLLGFQDDFLLGKMVAREGLQTFDFLRVWGNPRIRPDELVAGHVQVLLNRLYADYTANGLKNTEIVQAYLLALLCELNAVYRPVSDTLQQQSVALSNRFQELLFAQLKHKQLVTDYAELLHISPNHLNKVVKQATGKSPTNWIDETLVLEAKVLLYQTRLSVSEVATEIGLADPSYFSRLFKKYAGMSPIAFRKMIEKS